MNIFAENSRHYIGDINYAKGGVYGPRVSQAALLVGIFEGSVKISVDGIEKVTLHAGEVTLMPPGSEELYEFSQESTTSQWWCDWKHPDMDKEMRAQLDSLSQIVPMNARMNQILQLGLDTQKNGSALVADALARALYYEFLKEAGFKMKGLIDVEQRVPPLIREARRWIDAQFEYPMEVADIAKVVGISSGHLSRLFKQHYGKSARDYLWDKRILEASRYLSETGWPISEISKKVGFQTPYHFSRMFKQKKGMTPKDYRKQKWFDHRAS